jgi:hypothetical protein
MRRESLGPTELSPAELTERAKVRPRRPKDIAIDRIMDTALEFLPDLGKESAKRLRLRLKSDSVLKSTFRG